MARHDEQQVPDVEPDPTITFTPVRDASASGASGSTVAGAFGWALIVETGPQAGLTYVLADGETIAGRGASCDIFLGDVTVSREHARFSLEDGVLRIQDLGSTNGTYVNGAWADAYALSPGDEVIIGKFHLIVARGNI
ncbi:MAG: FHA domain-containing protein [Actinomycetota bacterium]|nr:FHA domain-containing protein [Actinomycetota bacterium]